MLNKRFVSAVAGMLCIASAVPAFGWEYAADEAPYSYNKTDEQKNPYGYGRKETLSVAIRISDEALVGKKVMGLRIPFNGTQGFTALSGWTSSGLLTEGNNVKTDGATATAEILPNGFTEIRFAEPYIIPEGGCYAGYTFTIEKNNDDSNASIILISGNQPGSFYSYGTYTDRRWKDKSGSIGSSAMEVIIGGLSENSLNINSLACSPGGKNKPNKAILTVSNGGINPIHSFEYTYNINGESDSVTVEIPEETNGKSIYSSSFYGMPYTLEVAFPAMEESGNYPVEFSITKVNGVDNGEDASLTADLKVVNRVTKKRPVVEEYTGTWCQYCSRGYAGMEYMDANFEDFIGIVYHNGNGDPMEVLSTNQFPESTGGFPYARMDRMKEVDAFHGFQPSGTYKFGLDAAWMEQEVNVWCPADIDVKAEWNDDETELNITSTVNFLKSDSKSVYRLAYALLHDEMSGKGSLWAQKNAYSGASQYIDHPVLGHLANSPGSVSGLKFNDVFIYGSNMKGINNSVPLDIVADTPYEHTFNIKLSDVKGNNNPNIIQDKKKLKVVVLLLDSQRKIQNAAKAFVPGYDGELLNVKGRVEALEVKPELKPAKDPNESAIDGIVSDDVTVVGIYDITGRRVENPEKGIYIYRLSNGKSVKKVVK